MVCALMIGTVLGATRNAVEGRQDNTVHDATRTRQPLLRLGVCDGSPRATHPIQDSW